MSTAVCDQLQGCSVHPGVTVGAWVVEALAPGKWRDVAVFVHGLVGDEAQALAQRRTGVGVGASQYGPRRGFFFGLSKSL